MKASILFRLMIGILVVLAVLAILPLFQWWWQPDASDREGVTPAAMPIPTQPPPPTPSVRKSATLTVDGTQWGMSSCYIGAVEGSSRFDPLDLQDLGINTYRLYGGIPRWEPEDDDGVYGSPSIAQIKANPDVINWDAWDKMMTTPPDGTDYWWDPKKPQWQGNARTLFSELQRLQIRTMITLRNQDDQLHPAWAPNPPRTEADWNEWWEHVFALTYWLNVRNNYDIHDFEVHNEPNIIEQGWRGTKEDYFNLVRYTNDAISYVHQTYLPGEVYHVYAPSIPVGPKGLSWPPDALSQIPDAFTGLSLHLYDRDTAPNVRGAHEWLDAAGRSDYPIWLTEWGSYEKQYNSYSFSIDLLTNLMNQSRPGKDYVYGSHIFALYDFDTTALGLIDYHGQRHPAYYAMRMGIRALQGCRPTYETITSEEGLTAMTTMDTEKNVYLLVTNKHEKDWYDISADLSALLPESTKQVGTMWQFYQYQHDTMVGQPELLDGKVTFTIPATGAVLLKFPAQAQ